MEDDFEEVFSLDETPTSNTCAGSGGKSKGILPVLIRQLHESTGNTVTLFGMRFSYVYFVVIVRSIKRTSTKITFTLEDWTGRIEANYWFDYRDDQCSIFTDISINEYVKVYGCPNTEYGPLIFKMKKVNDPNEILTHNLEVLQARFTAEEFSKRYAIDDDEIEQPTDVFPYGLDRNQHLVLEAIINHPNEDDGISRIELRAKFANLSHDEVDSILESLLQEGHIYPSEDLESFFSIE